jgi:hypothetical protein
MATSPNASKVFTAMTGMCEVCGHQMSKHSPEVRPPSTNYNFPWACQMGACDCTELGTWGLDWLDRA